MFSKPFPISVILENIRSAYNVGSMFRTSACFNLEKVYLVGITATPPHPGVEKTALGATSMIPWEKWEATLPLVQKLKSEGYLILALELTNKSIPIQDLKEAEKPIALIVGNEVDGVSQEALTLADKVIKIPLYGKKESLNVAVAFGIAVFYLTELFRKSEGF
ncbi:MAG: TrmH family RNA methyltransferase [Caldimicrobium sp.]|jgi:tRNA G18 (ribose-2'-O)-methylase SpoU|nr:TrmH family RNA methyltransferase [Caldimicrobium sp.]